MANHVVFVVAGYSAIGMGHIYRASMLAHEMVGYEISFVCTKESELAARTIAATNYPTVMQKENQNLASAVLDQKPDLIINDFLDTSAEYMQKLQTAHIPIVNFEDEGSGADFADLVFNALYETPSSPNRAHFFYGHHFFCLRDEFLQAKRNAFRPIGQGKGCLLITFGGTDALDFTRQSLDIAEPICKDRCISMRIVTGPGYLYKERLIEHLEKLNNPQIYFAYATNIMSRMMEGADVAICSAGRTVYELAHMRVPAIILAQHAREARHTFARPKNGFLYLGIMQTFHVKLLEKALHKVLDHPEERRKLYDRQSHIDFSQNKPCVVKKILSLLSSPSLCAIP